MGLTLIEYDRLIGPSAESHPAATLILKGYDYKVITNDSIFDDKNCNETTTDYIWLQKHSKTYKMISVRKVIFKNVS